jgi:hypothetical protein
MYCPNCGNQSSENQKFCRSCGLALEKVAQSIAEQLPTQLEENLQKKADKLDRLGVAALSLFGLTVLGFAAYGIFYKLMISQGKIWAGLAALGTLIVLGCGLASVILFAMANEKRQASAKRKLEGPAELEGSPNTKQLLPEAAPQPIYSVTDRTTELLFAEKKKEQLDRSDE